jgi:two-component system chemotaxis sensor kinase CheA
LDLAKYRTLFLEEASDHLAEMSRALLVLEKDPGSTDSIDLVFRMAHSTKSMAASLGYDAISEIAHRLEDRMQIVRSAGRIEDAADLPLLFRGLEALERMVEVVRQTGEPPPPDPELAEQLGSASGLKKKFLRPPSPR